jgi:DNA transposition AAA+ family ATPase
MTDDKQLRILKAFIVGSGLRQYQIAKQIGVHPAALSQMLCGIRPMRQGVAEKILNVLNLSEDVKQRVTLSIEANL